MKRVVAISFVVAASAWAQKSDVAAGTAGTLHQRSVTLPRCIDDAESLQDIKAGQAANSQTAHKYIGYRKVLEQSDDYELQARLVYAETLAANCPDKNNEIVDTVSQVIANRINKRKGDTKSVVFERNQFASSLNLYSESRYLDFLCPKDLALWQYVHKAVRVTSKLPSDTYNYYFYQHSKKFNPPAWADPAKAATMVKGSQGDCIGAFNLPNWK